LTPAPARASVRATDVELAVWCWGDPDAPPVILVHGWADCGASFFAVAAGLAAEFRVMAPDLRGFGDSGRPAHGYFFPDYLRDLEALFASPLVAGPVTLVGHSMGGNVCGLYAGVRPARVASLVLLEGFGLPDSRPEDAPRRYAGWLDQQADEPGLRDFGDFDALRAHLAKLAPRASRAVLDEVAHCWAQPVGGGAWRLKMDPRHKLANPVLYRRAEAAACWRATTAPVLLAAGDESDFRARFRGLDPLEDARAHYRDCRVATIAGAGHMMHWEQPDAVGELVRQAAAATALPA
jgi:pimeloyl-ACP methyl ester carboxylesterase